MNVPELCVQNYLRVGSRGAELSALHVGIDVQVVYGNDLTSYNLFRNGALIEGRERKRKSMDAEHPK